MKFTDGYNYYWARGAGFDYRGTPIVEDVQYIKGVPFFGPCDLTGQLVPWDQHFDRARARREAEKLQAWGFHL